MSGYLRPERKKAGRASIGALPNHPTSGLRKRLEVIMATSDHYPAVPVFLPLNRPSPSAQNGLRKRSIRVAQQASSAPVAPISHSRPECPYGQNPRSQGPCRSKILAHPRGRMKVTTTCRRP